jgi:hypothetical protein
MAATGAVVAGATLLYVRDPSASGSYPACPFRALTGWYCPGCGSLRAMHAVLHADPRRAVAFNPLTVCFLPFVVVCFGRWLSGAPPWRASARAGPLWALVAVIVAFAVLRNLPWAPFTALAP